jgi:hypothetical protein
MLFSSFFRFPLLFLFRLTFSVGCFGDAWFLSDGSSSSGICIYLLRGLVGALCIGLLGVLPG